MPATADELELRGVLLAAANVSDEKLALLKPDYDTVAVELTGADEAATRRESAAARRVLDSGLRLAYWVEVARQPQLADEHPDLMASLQGHDQWRRDYREFPFPAQDEVVKCWPWVPIVYRESFDAQRTRVAQLLADKPRAAVIFLNDLQSAPSACGCGHPLCRWTAHYGPIKTATPLESDAAARFVAEVQKIADGTGGAAAVRPRIVPVWATECEQHDKNGLCGGVGCYDGLCWKEYMKQLTPVARDSRRLAVLATYRELQRDLRVYGETAGWVATAIQSFQTMPAKLGATPIPADRLYAVLQGWDVSDGQIAAQIVQARQAGAAGYLVARCRIDQSWQPKLTKFKAP